MAASASLVRARQLTLVLIPLALIASGGGVFVPGLYRDAASLVPAIRGQDIVTLLASPVLAGALWAEARGSTRALLVWIGLLGYMLYAFTGAAFAYRFNQLFLVYLVAFSLSAAALVASLGRLNATAIRERFDAGTPRRAVAVFLGFIALVLSLSELGQVVSAIAAGTTPELLVRSEGAGNFVYVLDLGLVVPLSVASAWWLIRDKPWGYVLAGGMLIKASTMGLALLAGTWLSVETGIGLEVALTLAYGAIAVGAGGLSFRYFRHCTHSNSESGTSALTGRSTV